MRGAALAFLWLSIAQTALRADAQEAVQMVGPEEIPRAGYQSWSLFLICTPDWVRPEKSADLANLFGRFEAFGAAIGRDNAAVWFWKERKPLRDERLAENVDVGRSADYCKTLRLRPSEGPFLVVTTAYPELDAFPKERAVFTLGALDPAALARLLNQLTDQLLIEGKVAEVREASTPAAAEAASEGDEVSSGLWVQLLESARRTMIGAGCALKVQITTGILSAELRGCST